MPLWPLQLLIVRLLAFFNDNLSPVFNTYFILSFPAVAVAALYSFRRLGISRLTSLLCALLYAFLPFHILRGQSQLWLISYFMVPLACLLLIRLDQGYFVSNTSESNQCCPGKVAPTDGKSLTLNALWPVLPGNDLKSRGRKWPPERSIPTRHNGG